MYLKKPESHIWNTLFQLEEGYDQLKIARTENLDSIDDFGLEATLSGKLEELTQVKTNHFT